MRRPPGAHDVRAAVWAWRALHSTRAQLRAGAVRNVRIAAPPQVPPAAGRAVRLVIARTKPSCLERALVLQRWLLAQGITRDVVVGTRGSSPADFAAHAWLEGEGEPDALRHTEMIRLAP